ncbi:MAG: DNA alkylation repair protein [Firmicutes bacterium]|nr:DNA alkylation repair protein [Bacillota bacterium]
MNYTEFDYKILTTQLRQYSDEKYKEFHSGLKVGSNYIYGVRIPILRRMAKRIAIADWQGFLALAKDDSYEEILLQGMVLGYAKMSLEETFERTAAFLPKVDNWAICDTFCSGLKRVRQDLYETWAFLMRYENSPLEFERRFVVVMLMDYFLEGKYLDQALDVIVNIRKEEYYVSMAAAWALATAFLKDREGVLRILEEEQLDQETHNRTIRKCRESYRISDEDKALLNGLKRV